jgi:radical SAM protein with 4Fe4S-binding SPASM domain
METCNKINHLTKVELLWTYLCPRACSGCAMNAGAGNSRSLHDWKIGIDNFKELGASFLAIYGAEPLADFDNLPEVIKYSENIGINTTVITSYPFNDLCKKYLHVLYEYGLRSLTTSFDPIPYDEHSKNKSEQAVEMLQYFQSMGPIRDTAAVVTVTTKNIEMLPDLVVDLSMKGIWMFCDLMHWNKGNEGTKCKGNKREWHLDYSDIDTFQEVYDTLLKMKKKGALVHVDPLTVKKIVDDGLHFSWYCSTHSVFPSWITIDPHGQVHPCDDFKPERNKKFDMMDIAKKWGSFSSFYRKQIDRYCKGCSWCTHIQSHSIKSGEMELTDYIHGMEV